MVRGYQQAATQLTSAPAGPPKPSTPRSCDCRGYSVARIRRRCRGSALADSDDALGDRGDAGLRRRDDALAVLVRLLVGDDRANVVGDGQPLDRGNRVADAQVVVLADGELLGIQHADGGATRMQRVGGPVRALGT